MQIFVKYRSTLLQVVLLKREPFIFQKFRNDSHSSLFNGRTCKINITCVQKLNYFLLFRQHYEEVDQVYFRINEIFALRII